DLGLLVDGCREILLGPLLGLTSLLHRLAQTERDLLVVELLGFLIQSEGVLGGAMLSVSTSHHLLRGLDFGTTALSRIDILLRLEHSRGRLVLADDGDLVGISVRLEVSELGH
ncbi:hypothetical protein PFISCL1PPCAC_16327, partial [Pristionchus fissidentatus]